MGTLGSVHPQYLGHCHQVVLGCSQAEGLILFGLKDEPFCLVVTT